MATMTPQQEHAVETAIREISHIATLPEITVRIIELVEDPTSTAQDLHNVIANDPALCSRVLKVVNSSFYGLPGQVGSINRAIVLLGLNAVKNIAISASLSKLFRGGRLSPLFSARELWMHSVAVATACKSVANSLDMAVTDQAFLAGLIHDLGIMVEMQLDRNKLIEVVGNLGVDDAGAPGRCMREAEAEIFDADHQQFGFGLATKWKFPQGLAQVCGYHHDPMLLPAGARTLACIVYVGDRLTAQLDMGFRLDVLSTEIDPAVMEELGLTEELLEGVREVLPEHFEEVQMLLS